jgi:hypothetical protein
MFLELFSFVVGWASDYQKGEIAESYAVGKIPASLIDSQPLG